MVEMQVAETSWLFNNPTASDAVFNLRIELMEDADPVAGSDKTASIRIPIHTAIVSSLSDWFKARLTSHLWHQGDSALEAQQVHSNSIEQLANSLLLGIASSAEKQSCSEQDSSAEVQQEEGEASRPVKYRRVTKCEQILDDMIHQNDLKAALEVIRWMYSKTFEDNAVQHLTQVIRLADRWGVTSCVSAALSNIDPGTVTGDQGQEDVVAVVRLGQTIASLHDDPAYTGILRAYQRALVAYVGHISRRTLLLAVDLPFELLWLWMASDELTAASEGDVLFFISMWWAEQYTTCFVRDGQVYNTPDDRNPAEILSQAEILTKTARIGSVSASYAGMLCHMPWWAVSNDKIRSVATALTQLATEPGLTEAKHSLKDELPPGYDWLKPRRHVQPTTATLEVKISKERVEHMFRYAADHPGVELSFLSTKSSVLHFGFLWDATIKYTGGQKCPYLELLCWTGVDPARQPTLIATIPEVQVMVTKHVSDASVVRIPSPLVLKECHVTCERRRYNIRKGTFEVRRQRPCWDYVLAFPQLDVFPGGDVLSKRDEFMKTYVGTTGLRIKVVMKAS